MAETNESDSNGVNDCEQNEDSSDQFARIIKQGYDALMPTIRASNSLPKGQQWDLFCTSPSFKPIMDSLGNKALELMGLILQHQGINRDVRKRDLEEKYELMVEANDKILERVGIYMDELSGIRRNPAKTVADIPVSPVSTASGSWNRDIAKSAAWREVKLSKNTPVPVVLRNARVTQRPQVKFVDKIDNSSSPFEPRIKEKPNALKPLAILYEEVPGEDPCYSHPYEFELERFQERIELLDLLPKEPKLPKPLEETPLVMVTEEQQLDEMLQELRTQTEIAIDLEHHSYRSFQGFTCLMQISTRDKDYIVDTLELRHKLHTLNQVFTNPNIVKVFHGADCDVQWLQRDLSLYVVNMFDTYQASLLLSLPRLSLAFLMKTFCNVDANKQFQLYDWRTRPLAKEAVKYAREDTHYLLYIYDILWNKLLDKSSGGTQMLQSALYRSADTCKKRYWKCIFKEDSHESMYRQSKKNFDNRQIYALKELYAWRDRTAREEDESSGYVLPNHMLLLIAEKLPKEMQGILACCNPIPPLVRQNLVFLHQMVLKAREQPLVVRVSTGMNSEARVRPIPQTSINLEGALHCPHDLTHNVDFRDDLTTLLSERRIDISSNIDLIENQPLLHIFEEKNDTESVGSKMNLPNQIHFMSPFDRYKKMLVYIENEENKSEEEKRQELAQDTQKLLDECMREIQKNAAIRNKEDTEMLNIKEESLDPSQQSRKRVRSQDNSECETSQLVSPDVTIKEETTHEDNKQKRKKNKKGTNYEQFKTDTVCSTPVESGHLKVEQDCSTEEEPPKKKRNKTTEGSKSWNETVSMEVSSEQVTGTLKKESKNTKQNKKSSEDFIQYDYSQVDYNQFQQSESSHTPKTSKDKFKLKGKKKQQNRSFTFARQYGGGGNKKKS